MVFWGRGAILSGQGQNIMNLMGAFLQRVPGRVVVSETGPTEAQDGQGLGMPRAWAVIQYLSTRQSVDPDRFSISAMGIVAHDGSQNQALGRMVEITLLERNTYN